MTFRIEYDNDTGPGDEGFWEWFDVYEDDRRIARCDSRADADRIVKALNVLATLAGE